MPDQPSSRLRGCRLARWWSQAQAVAAMRRHTQHPLPDDVTLLRQWKRMGREFYYAVAADVEMAVPWAECEQICYFFADLCHERYGSFPETGSGISRESGSNPAGWPR